MRHALLALLAVMLVAGCERQTVSEVNREYLTDVIWAIEPEYHRADAFSSGLAMVYTDATDYHFGMKWSD